MLLSRITITYALQERARAVDCLCSLCIFYKALNDIQLLLSLSLSVSLYLHASTDTC